MELFSAKAEERGVVVVDSGEEEVELLLRRVGCDSLILVTWIGLIKVESNLSLVGPRSSELFILY